MKRILWITAIIYTFEACLSGCATTKQPVLSEKLRAPVIERGVPIPPLDLLAKLLALPEQLIFWDFRLKNRNVSDTTLEELRQFLMYYQLNDVKVRVNRTAPIDQYRRLFGNDDLFWLFKVFPGFFVTTISLISERITAGDYYNPYTNTIHLFSDIPAVALHEGGHAKDTAGQDDGGLNSVLRIVPGMDIIQEDTATTTAINYFMQTKDYRNEIEAYRILYPAYGSYFGAYLNPVLPIRTGSVGAILAGHGLGRKKARERQKIYSRERARAAGSDSEEGASAGPKSTPNPAAVSAGQVAAPAKVS